MYVKFFAPCMRIIMYISPMIWLVLSLAHFIFGSGYAADPSAGKPVPIGVFSRFSVSTMTGYMEAGQLE